MTGTKKWIWFFFAVLLILPHPCGMACAESLEDEIVFYQNTWDSLLNRVKGELTDQDFFAGSMMYDALGFLTEEKDCEPLKEAVLAADSGKNLEKILDGGLLDVAAFPYQDDAILDQVRSVMKAAGLSMPECFFIQHFRKGMYLGAEGWRCALGRTVGRDEALVEHVLYLYGDRFRLALLESEGLEAARVGTPSPERAERCVNRAIQFAKETRMISEDWAGEAAVADAAFRNAEGDAFVMIEITCAQDGRSLVCQALVSPDTDVVAEARLFAR